MDDLTFDQFAHFIREFWRVSSRKQITPDTQFERDLGLTGDDGVGLLLATEKRFGVNLGSKEHGVRETFDLGPNEYLFNSEGWGINPFGAKYTVRKFTVGALFEAVRNATTRERQPGREQTS